MFDDTIISRRWIFEKVFGQMIRPRPVCSCEVPDYAEDLFDRGEYRYRCGTCRGYIDMVWILEGHFPEPSKKEAPVPKKRQLCDKTDNWKLSDEYGALTKTNIKALGVSETFFTGKRLMEVQTRSSCGELKYFPTLREARDYADGNSEVWKISFALSTGERVRLVKRDAGWVWEDIVWEVEKELGVVIESLDYGPPPVLGRFRYMDQFYIDGRGLVLTGILEEGTVAPGMQVVINYRVNELDFSQPVRIKGVERMGRSKNVGLLLGSVSIPVDGYDFSDVVLTVEDEFPIVE